MGMTLEDCVKGVKDDWGNQVKMGCLPRHWRDRRSTYQLSLDNAGWWVDVEHPDSIQWSQIILSANPGLLGKLNKYASW